MKLWECLDEVERAYLVRYQRKYHPDEPINPPAAETPPAPVIPVHIDEQDLAELRKGSHYRPGGADAGL